MAKKRKDDSSKELAASLFVEMEKLGPPDSLAPAEPEWMSEETVDAISKAITKVMDEHIPGWREMSGELFRAFRTLSPGEPHYVLWSISVMNLAERNAGRSH